MAEQLQLAERMQTTGTLAGGVAHDFDNQLLAILGNARLLRDVLAPSGLAAESLGAP